MTASRGLLRIVAGDLRGRRIRVPDGAEVRPTGDRVREALFAILGSRVEGAGVVDAFAGSGALGLEAISRGAARVLFLESDPAVASVLRDNVRALGVAQRCRVVVGDACRGWGALGGPVDLVLADPPYGAAGEGERLLRAIGSASALAPTGWIVLERDREAPVSAGNPRLECFRTARYGRSCLDFYRLAGF